MVTRQTSASRVFILPPFDGDLEAVHIDFGLDHADHFGMGQNVAALFAEPFPELAWLTRFTAAIHNADESVQRGTLPGLQSVLSGNPSPPDES